MTWLIEGVETKLLNSKISGIAMCPETILEAIGRAERVLGAEWIASTASAKGLAPTMDIVGTGLRLRCLEGIMDGEKLIEQIRRKNPAAEAELTAIYLFCSYDPRATVELYPAVGNRRADFRVRRDSEPWTTVEVTLALPSNEEKRVTAILRRITDSLRNLDVQFVLEIQFRREPTDKEVEVLCDRLPEFCRLPGRHSAELVDGMGFLFRDESDIGWLRFHDIPELAATPMVGLAMFQSGGPGGGPHHQVAIRIPFSDTRAESFLTDEAKQLPKAGPGLIMICGPSSPNEVKVWTNLIQQRLQPKLHTRVSAVCLFTGGMVPVDSRYGWRVQASLITNPHAKTPLPNWMTAAVESHGNNREWQAE
jgi:hypothetical protein